jgi:hypothetical protein
MIEKDAKMTKGPSAELVFGIMTLLVFGAAVSQ